MIELTHLSGIVFMLNPHLIETAEARPDTTLHLTSGNKMVVKESMAVLLERIVAYRRSIGVFAESID